MNHTVAYQSLELSTWRCENNNKKKSTLITIFNGQYQIDTINTIKTIHSLTWHFKCDKINIQRYFLRFVEAVDWKFASILRVHVCMFWLRNIIAKEACKECAVKIHKSVSKAAVLSVAFQLISHQWFEGFYIWINWSMIESESNSMVQACD